MSLFGGFEHHHNKYLLEMKYPLLSWVMYHWDIYQPLQNGCSIAKNKHVPFWSVCLEAFLTGQLLKQIYTVFDLRLIYEYMYPPATWSRRFLITRRSCKSGWLCKRDSSFSGTMVLTEQTSLAIIGVDELPWKVDAATIDQFYLYLFRDLKDKERPKLAFLRSSASRASANNCSVQIETSRFWGWHELRGLQITWEHPFVVWAISREYFPWNPINPWVSMLK